MKKLFMRLVSFIMVIATVCSLCIVPAYAATYTPGTFIVTHAKGVNVRSKAATSGSVFGASPKGSSFQVTKVSGNWGYTDKIKTTKGIKAGWVCLDYCKGIKSTTITFSDLSAPTTVEKGKGCHISGKILSSNAKFTTITASIINSSGNNVIKKTVEPNAKSYNLYNSTLDNAMTFGKLNTGKYTIKFTAKTADGTSKTISKDFTVKDTNSNTENDKVHSSGYSKTKALNYAEKHAKDGKGLCAEFVSRCLIAGGLDIKVYTGCGSLFRALDKIDGVTKYKLTVEKDGSVLPKNNKGKISSGDVVIMYHTDEPDGKPYIHTVLVGDTASDGVKVYAHNRAYKNQTYYGFDYCGDCKSSSGVVAYVFHFE